MTVSTIASQAGHASGEYQPGVCNIGRPRSPAVGVPATSG